MMIFTRSIGQFLIRLSHSDDKANLLKLREFTKSRLETIGIVSTDKVLEIGPNRSSGAKNSPIFQRHPHTFYDVKARSEKEGFSYFDLDIDPSVNPFFLGDISSSDFRLPEGMFDKVICFSVLEHVFELKTAVENIAGAIQNGGELHVITPWDLRFHGPRPDCWRISDDAYRLLLEPHFRKVDIHQIPNKKRPLSPVGLYVVATR
jgi:hypothetical protein